VCYCLLCVEQDLCSDIGRSRTEHLVCSVSPWTANHSYWLWGWWDTWLFMYVGRHPCILAAVSRVEHI